MSEPWRGWLQLDGWEGRTQQEVEVIGETPKRYRIRALTRTRLAGYCRWVQPGSVALVPKAAVRRGPGAAEVSRG